MTFFYCEIIKTHYPIKDLFFYYHFMQKQKIYFYGFTLVELIIVISILAILAIIAFVSFQNYTKEAKDSGRIATLKNIDTGLSLYHLKAGNYPEPDDSISISNEDSSIILLKQWIIWKNISSLIHLSKEVYNTDDNTLYLYSITGDYKKYQLWVYLEDNDSISFIPSTYAQYNYANKFFYTIWNKIWILLDAGTKKPITKTNYWTGLKLGETSNNFIVYFSNDTESGSIIGTGGVLWEKIQQVQQIPETPKAPETENTFTIKCNNDIALTWNKIYFNLETLYSFTTTVEMSNTITYNSWAQQNTCEWKCAEGFHENNSSCVPNQSAPSWLQLNHTPGNKTFTFSLNAGSGNAESCKLQYHKNNTTWTNINGTIYNCDSDILSQSVTLPGDGWNGTWSSLWVRILRVSDNEVIGSFQENLTCNVSSGSVSATPNIDEDCDGLWDDNAEVWTLNGTTASYFHQGTLAGCGMTTTQCKTWGASTNRKYISVVNQPGYNAYCCYGNNTWVTSNFSFNSAEHYILQSAYN